MGDCKRITATAKEVVVNVRDGSKTAVSTFKEIATNLKTVSLVTEAPLKCFEVELKGLGEGDVSEASLFRYNGDSTQALETFSKLFVKPITELSSATEVLRVNAAKLFTELQTASDNLLLVVSWVRKIDDGLRNQFVNNDILVASFGKILLGHSLVTDTTAKSVAKGFSDSNLATDMVASVFQAPKQDTSATSDSITLLADFRPVIQDWVHMTDDVLGTVEGDRNKVVVELRTVGEKLSSALNKRTSVDAWSINDIAIKSVDISLRDFFGVPDVLGKSLAASKADAAAMSHACTANLQNYMSASYVDVGYVGFNYTL